MAAKEYDSEGVARCAQLAIRISMALPYNPVIPNIKTNEILTANKKNP